MRRSMPTSAICVVSDPAIRRALERGLAGAGLDAEFVEADDAADHEGEWLFLEAGARALLERIRPEVRVLLVGASLDDAVLAALREPQVDHAFVAPEGPDPADIVTALGLCRDAHPFGLSKHVAWGAAVEERRVITYEEKASAVADLGACARRLGARRLLATRVESVADELLMNAIYDAPGSQGGAFEEIVLRARDPRARLCDRPVQLAWASDGDRLALSVRDLHGTLAKHEVLTHVLDARARRGLPRAGCAGAGLGLHIVLSSPLTFVASVAAGALTEVICLFELSLTNVELQQHARGVHFQRRDLPGLPA